MEWEIITAPQLKKAADAGAICIVPFGCLEQHGPHSPLGTDMIIANGVTRLAAQQTGDVVFPGYYFGQINEGRHVPGAVAIEPTLAMQVLQNTMDEIARNGFKKIVLYNCHGGNVTMANYFLQIQLSQERDYVVYFCNVYNSLPHDGLTYNDVMAKIFPKWCTYDWHGGEKETSMVMALAGVDTIDKDAVCDSGMPLGRLGHLAGAGTALGWYANCTEHFSGDARGASLEAGQECVKLYVDGLIRHLNAIRADKVTPDLQREFFDRVRNL